MKVLMLDPSASAVSVTHNLCNHLVEMGCEVHVFTGPRWLLTTEAIGAKPMYRSHVRFYRGTQLRSYQASGILAKLFWRLIRLAQHVCAMISVCIAAREYDIVHTQILPVPAFDYFCLRFIARRTPIVCTVHELVPHSSKCRQITGHFFRQIYRRAQLLFVYTDYTRDRLLQEQGVTAEKVLKIPHGNLEHLLSLKPPPDSVARNESPVVLFIGGIRGDKGLDTLIKAVSYLRQRLPNFRVQVAGMPGPNTASILKLAKELRLQDMVNFRLEFLSEHEFAKHLEEASIVALPYRRIEQSGVAIAACTFGKAIVATRCGGVAELVTEAGNGLLVPVDDAVSFAEALRVLLLDEEKRKLCELRSRKYASEVLSWGPIAAKTMDGYRIALRQQSLNGARAVTEPS